MIMVYIIGIFITGTIFGYLVNRYRKKVKAEKKIINEVEEMFYKWGTSKSLKPKEVEGMFANRLTESKEKGNLRSITTPKPTPKPSPQKSRRV